MKIYLKKAFDATRWYWSSSTALVGTLFIADTVATKLFNYNFPSIWWSVGIAFVFVAITFAYELVIILHEDLIITKGNLTHITSKNDQLSIDYEKLRKAEDIKSKEPFIFNRGIDKYYIYGQAVLLLKDAFSWVHQLEKENPIVRKDVRKTFKQLCEYLKAVFEEGAPNKKYSVAIKIFNPDNNASSEDNSELIVIYSDEASRKKRGDHYKKTIILGRDTCYEHILNMAPNQKDFCYMSNNVPAEKGYDSSFFDSYPFVGPSNTEQERIANWPLLYRSELVVPICPVHLTTSPFDKMNQVAGFLCVDCDEIDGFHPRYDIGLLQGVADGIYDMLLLSLHHHKSQTTTQNIG